MFCRKIEESVVLVLHGNCNDNIAYSFQINGHETEFLGPGVLRDFRFNSMEHNFTIAPLDLMEATNDQTYCQHDVQIYPTKAFRDKFYSSQPFFYGMMVASCFVAASLVFLIYGKYQFSRACANTIFSDGLWLTLLGLISIGL